jgi:UDP-glucose 4-epimerase
VNVAGHYAVIGGAGFIGSHFVDELIEQGIKVTVVDNFCSGTISHLNSHLNNPLLKVIELEADDTVALARALDGCETVIHLASNPDIARAAVDPRIDFVQGTVLTESVAEASRIANVSCVLYASGSGVYGDAGENVLTEDSPLRPISTYGASKLAGESLLASYSYMFGIKTLAFRFANVVGPRQTHGVGYDFIRRLRLDPSKLEILGNGRQSKSYVHVADVVSGVLAMEKVVESGHDFFNISTPDYLTVDEIAECAFRVLGIDPKTVHLRYSGGDRGWKADVPIVRLSAEKIIARGWKFGFTSESAMENALLAMKKELELS